MINKFFLSTVVLSSIAFGTLAILPNEAVSAKKNTRQRPLFWTNISQVLFAKKPPINPRKGGSRGDLCMISPDAPRQTRIVWSDRPLFLWQGQVKKIELTNISNNTKFWDQTVEKIQQQTYTGKPLQPGKTYKWEVFIGDSPAKFVKFRIMESQQRDRITAELNALENQLKAKGANAEAIALAKAEYFAKYNLWSDVLQQAYSVQQPSAELAKIIEEIPQRLCADTPSDSR